VIMGIRHLSLTLLALCLLLQSANAQAVSPLLSEARQNHLLSQKLHASGDDDQALRRADKAIQLAPNEAEFHYWKAELLFETEDDDQIALAEAMKACSIASNACYEYLRAHLLYRLHRLPEALSAANKSIALGASIVNFKLKAEILMAIGHWQEAEDCLGVAIKKFGASIDFAILRANVGATLKHWSLVHEECNQVILMRTEAARLKPKVQVQAYLLRALASYELGQTAQARKEYLDVLAHWPDSREVHAAALHFFEKTGDTKNAEKEKQSLQKFDKDVMPL